LDHHPGRACRALAQRVGLAVADSPLVAGAGSVLFVRCYFSL